MLSMIEAAQSSIDEFCREWLKLWSYLLEVMNGESARSCLIFSRSS